jgi:hypothetical protein
MLYKYGVFKSPRNSSDEEEAVPRYQRPPSASKVIRSHNKDEPAIKSAQGHYLKRQASNSKFRSSELSGDYKYGNQS